MSLESEALFSLSEVCLHDWPCSELIQTAMSGKMMDLLFRNGV